MKFHLFSLRSGPVYKNISRDYYKLDGDNNGHYIINPTAPIYTVDGSAGNAYYMVPETSKLII